MQKGSWDLTLGAILGKNGIKYNWDAVKAMAVTVGAFCVAMAGYADQLPNWMDHGFTVGVTVASIVATITGLFATAQALPPLVVPEEPKSEE